MVLQAASPFGLVAPISLHSLINYGACWVGFYGWSYLRRMGPTSKLRLPPSGVLGVPNRGDAACGLLSRTLLNQKICAVDQPNLLEYKFFQDVCSCYLHGRSSYLGSRLVLFTPPWQSLWIRQGNVLDGHWAFFGHGHLRLCRH